MQLFVGSVSVLVLALTPGVHLADLLADLLELEGVGSERASNGQETVAMFGDSPVGYYDAIIMDFRMPVMSGIEAAKVIRDMYRDDA